MKFGDNPVVKSVCSFCLSLLVATSAFAQTPPDTTDYFSDKSLRYEDHVYEKNIRTAQLFSATFNLGDPLIKLGSGEQLRLSFDDLDGGYKAYYYTVVHCSANWEPSNIMLSEYLDGFPDQSVTEYKYSRNTIQKYTHYFAIFPHENMKILRSGNYLLKVYTDNDQEKLVFTRRFMVYEDLVSIQARAHQATIIESRNFKQEVDFTINTTGYDLPNPFGELNVILRQNNRWDNAVTGLKPQFVRDKELIYDYDEENVFKGGSEFRWCDTRSLRYQNTRMAKFTFENNENHAYMINDEKRTFKRYLSSEDLNGRYIIHMDDYDASYEGDYAWVHFFLAYDPPTTEGNLYVFGGLSNWQCQPEFKLTYNKERKGYEGKVFLKQGYYDYEYVLMRDNEKAADDFFIEGMHWETTNEYQVYVYRRAPGNLYDQLIGVKKVNSNQ
ncbi:MAG: hypothetical protein FD123_2968 [Bacteroidetes bacterium]|nr:MAG: hypothetical protein FD123_2968 [Bacteroidota bacterium]